MVIYRASGGRSAMASSLLRRAGFTEVTDLLGGYQTGQPAFAHSQG